MTAVLHASRGRRLLDVAPDEVTGSLARAGALLLRGFAFEDADFSTLTRRFSDTFFTHGKRKVMLDEQTIEVVPGNQRVAPHQELGYLPFRPDYLWLLCRTPAREGGRTQVLPADRLFAELTPSTQRLFETTEIVYLHRWHEAMWQGYWPHLDLEAVQTDLRGRDGVTVHADSEPTALRFDYRTSALRRGPGGEPLFLNSILNMLDVMRKGDATAVVALASGRPVPPEVIEELEAVAARVSVPVEWEPRDVLVVDNHRSLHAREMFSGPRDVLVRIGARADWR